MDKLESVFSRLAVDMTSLPLGTVVEFTSFTAVTVTEKLLLVFESDNTWIREGNLITVEARGANDWVVRVSDGDWHHYDFWIKRDWNNKVSSSYFDEYDWPEWDSHDEWDHELDHYDEYDW